MCFGEAAKEMVNLRYGVVIGILNPKLLPKKDGSDFKGLTFAVETAA
jgi:hypothetical protein